MMRQNKSSISFLIRYVFWFAVFFCVFYFESIEINAETKLSQIWKIPLIVFLFLFLLKHKRFAASRLTKVAYFNAAKNLFNQGIIKYPITNFIEMVRAMNFALIYESLNVICDTATKTLNLLVRISQYYIISSIPFLLGYLESFREGMDFGSGTSYMGIFQNAHGASTITTMATLVLIFYVRNYSLGIMSRLYQYALIVLGIYCIYLSFVRTGYLMFALGILVILWPAYFNFKKIVFFCIIVGGLATGFVHQVENNDEFSARIFDITSSGQKGDFGSGRDKFAEYSLLYWAEGDLQQIILGRGIKDVMSNLELKYGLEIISHNGFVDALVTNGVIGLGLLVLFIIFFYKAVNECRYTKPYRLGLATVIVYISFQITQGGSGFPMDLIIALTLTLLKKEKSACGQ